MVSIVSVLLLSGCTWFAPQPTKDAESMLRAGISNFAAKQSADYDLKLDATMLGRDTESKAQNVTLHFALAGDTSTRPDAPAFNGNLSADVLMNEDVYDFRGELRANKSALFAVLTSLSIPEDILDKSTAQQFLNTWWKVPFPAGLASGGKSAPADVQKLLGAVTMYLRDLAYDGADTIQGKKSYRYVAALDNEKVRNLLIDYQVDQGRQLTANEVKQLEDFLANFSGKVIMWVSIDDEVLNRAKIELVMNKIQSADGKALGKGSIKGDLTYSNFGKEVVVEEPKEALEYDFLGKFGSMFGLQP